MAVLSSAPLIAVATSLVAAICGINLGMPAWLVLLGTGFCWLVDKVVTPIIDEEARALWKRVRQWRSKRRK